MMRNGTNTSFGQLQQINAGVLHVGYAEAGKSDGPAVMLLHGWPYDIHSYVDVAPRLAQAGYRVIVPYLCGSGTTRFLSSDTFRNGQQSVVAVDLIALLDALKSERAILAGFDSGRAVGQHHRGHLPAALQGPRLGEWLSKSAKKLLEQSVSMKRSGTMFAHILVPLDGSAPAEEALPVAARIARASRGSIHLLEVVSSPIDFGRRG